MATCVAAGTVAAALFLMGQREKANAQASYLIKTTGNILGIQVTVDGKENLEGERPCVFVWYVSF
jgi:hypothetical protein